MKHQLSMELKDFIVSFCNEMKIRNINLDDICLNTSIDMDLNIFDSDMDVFLSDFIKRFNIDVSNFECGNRYLYPSGDDMGLMYMVFRSLDYRKEWVRRICKRLYKPKIFVRDFQRAIDIRSL